MDFDIWKLPLFWVILAGVFMIFCIACYCICNGRTKQLPQQRKAKKINAYYVARNTRNTDMSPSYDYGFADDSIQFRDVTQQFGYYSGNKGCDTNGGDECARNDEGGGYSCSDNVGGGDDGGVCDSGGGGGDGGVCDSGGGGDGGGGDGGDCD